MRKFIRKTVSAMIGLAMLTAGAAPANAWYIVYYIDSHGYYTGYHFYCDNGYDLPFGPMADGYNTGYSYYYEYHTGEYEMYPWC